jgi:hypothetical protein
MSRTKKDRPYWVKLNDKKVAKRPHHNHAVIGKTVRGFRGNIITYADECTLEQPETHSSNDDHRRPCSYLLGYGYGYWLDGMTREDRMNTYYNPLRTMEREELTKAKKEYNATGDIEKDIAFPDGHRHGMLGGGYWD